MQAVGALGDVGGRPRVGTEADVVDHAELGEHLAALGHQHQTLADDAARCIELDAVAEQQHVAADGSVQPRERAHEGGLAGAVGAEHGDELALARPPGRCRG